MHIMKAANPFPATLGSSLGEARQKKRMTLAELSRQSGIALKNIEALERGDIESLPPPVYIEGMLRKIAHILEIDGKELVDGYRRRLGDTPPSRSSQGSRRRGAASPAAKLGNLAVTPERTMAFGAALLVAAVAGYVLWALQPILRQPLLRVAYPARDVRVGSPHLTIEGAAELGSDLTVNSEPVYLDEAGRFRASYVLDDGVNRIEIIARSRFGKTAKAVRYVVYAPK